MLLQTPVPQTQCKNVMLSYIQQLKLSENMQKQSSFRVTVDCTHLFLSHLFARDVWPPTCLHDICRFHRSLTAHEWYGFCICKGFKQTQLLLKPCNLRLQTAVFGLGCSKCFTIKQIKTNCMADFMLKQWLKSTWPNTNSVTERKPTISHQHLCGNSGDRAVHFLVAM